LSPAHLIHKATLFLDLRGDVAAAITCLRDASRLAHAAQDAATEAEALCFLSELLLTCERFDEATEALRQLFRLSAEAGNRQSDIADTYLRRGYDLAERYTLKLL
jgi:tetratricopeptide (TPR) repeat protein